MSKAIEVLRGLQWDRIAVCPICAFTRTHGHAPDCALDAALMECDDADGYGGWIAIRERLPDPLQRIELRSAPLTGCFRDDSCPPNVWTHWREMPAPGCALGAALREGDALPTFPPHKCGLSLTHNDHRNVYETLTDYVANRDLSGDFASAEAMQRAIDTDEIWKLQWYPETPIGSQLVVAPTLAEVLGAVTTDEGDGWIPVGQRLPQVVAGFGTSKTVLVHNGDGIRLAQYGYEMWSGFSDTCGCCDAFDKTVTHWRELPPPPQKETT